MATTEAEWLMRLPQAIGAHVCTLGQDSAQVQIGTGRLHLQWRPLPPRVIALLRLQRLAVSFRFEGVDEAERLRFMQHFDLSTQRGGG